MPFKHSEEADLEPYTLGLVDLKNTGRLIRACAEFEDIIRYKLYEVLVIDKTEGATLLGNLSLTPLLNKLERLVRLQDHPERKDIIKLKERVKEIIQTRNVLAHGSIAGRHSGTGQIVFFINQHDLLESDEVRGLEVQARGITQNHIALAAHLMEGEVRSLEDKWSLQDRGNRQSASRFRRKLDTPKKK